MTTEQPSCSGLDPEDGGVIRGSYAIEPPTMLAVST
jgi:hypothetical protein